MIKAIEDGQSIPPLVKRIDELEREIVWLTEDLEKAKNPPDVDPIEEYLNIEEIPPNIHTIIDEILPQEDRRTWVVKGCFGERHMSI